MSAEVSEDSSFKHARSVAVDIPASENRTVIVPPEDNTELYKLAHQLSRMSNQSGTSHVVENPFSGDTSDPQLDPMSDKFNMRAWLHAIMRLNSASDTQEGNKTVGFSFTDLSVFGYTSGTDYQKTVVNSFLTIAPKIASLFGRKSGQHRIDILKGFDALVKPGEMLLVLGKPGSGCTTLLKTIAGEMHDLSMPDNSFVNYQGISSDEMHKFFRGEAIYNAETDVHFPTLTVGATLSYAARARTPRNRIKGVTRAQYALHLRDVVMAAFGLTHTMNTIVGNDFIRGISGGERKRVSIAEVFLSLSPIQCWDNSTRGLDSANAIEFVRTLRLGTEFSGSNATVSLYQAPQEAYDVFDKVTVLYEGYQIYFGSAEHAKAYFQARGWFCPPRQTTADFLTSLTNPAERVCLPGWESKVPRTAHQFAQQWRESDEYKALRQDIASFEQKYPIHGERFESFKNAHSAQQARRLSYKSPYTISFPMQVRLCMDRGFERLKSDSLNFYATFIGNTILSLVLGSLFYNRPSDSSTLTTRGTIIFIAVLTNGMLSFLEILSLYEQRPVTEKHERFALYHPNAEVIASMICALPLKVVANVGFNLSLYFLSNLRREAGAFFVFTLFTFMLTLTMSSQFRLFASVTQSLEQAMAPSTMYILVFCIYTGFVIPVSYMKPWFRWINYLNPFAYAFESLMANEYHNRRFLCATTIPSGIGYENLTGNTFACSAPGAVAGELFVDGDVYINTTFQYYNSHKWRNLGIIIGLWVFSTGLYFLASAYVKLGRSKGEVLVFQRGDISSQTKGVRDDEASSGETGDQKYIDQNEKVDAIVRQEATFHWRNVCYDIKIKGNPRRILNRVDGWVKPGTLTALMGASGAGKTTLLDVLASRASLGVVSGEIFVDGKQRDTSFQRSTGYVQQQDIHLATDTVREALRFSALMRQPKTVSRADKYAYVEEVIKLLDMEEFSNAVVGVPGVGLNVEQRKRLTIGVELAAKPDLLLFFDEPTSGLDSQTAWSMCKLMRKLANNGQAIMCTIHQPSAILMQEFDRLLFLQDGGRTVYFGPIGQNCVDFVRYFESKGAFPCPPEGNPAEWMLQVIGAAPGHSSDIDWHKVWRTSEEYADVHHELDKMESQLVDVVRSSQSTDKKTQYAMPLAHQTLYATVRLSKFLYRSPSYIYSKLMVAVLAGLFIGFSFWHADNTIQGLQNQMFGIFMMINIFNFFVQFFLPVFVLSRSIFDSRERPSMAYSWVSFLTATFIVELPWQVLSSTIVFFTWYYPIALYRNAGYTNSVHLRGAQMFLLITQMFVYNTAFSMMVVAGTELVAVASTFAHFAFSFSLFFCGVLASPGHFPHFWIWLYRVSPFTYVAEAMLTTAVANAPVECSDVEYVRFAPAAGETCGTYMAPYLKTHPGYLRSANATDVCMYCPASTTDNVIAQYSMKYSHSWRDFGILFVHMAASMGIAYLCYWAYRVPKTKAPKKLSEEEMQKVETQLSKRTKEE